MGKDGRVKHMKTVGEIIPEHLEGTCVYGTSPSPSPPTGEEGHLLLITYESSWNTGVPYSMDK